jgi:maltooligosyltrehalose trehalohydrolase
MPFGAQTTPEEEVFFRVYAPAAGTVELCLEAGAGAPRVLPMQAGRDGWHHLLVAGAGAGDLYRFRVAPALMVPDPASRYQPEGVHGPSEVIAPESFHWQDAAWPGRPWEEAVIYELHVGTFSPDGTFHGIVERLDYLVDLGITAIELMPVAEFPGRRNWGYDGALLFAPSRCYGRPEDLKILVQEAHRRGLMILLDVVYNHFGPEGNYLHAYARQPFFTDNHHTPWGAAINFDGEGSRTVRDFFIHNALYWLEEYHFDGLRFDAVHAIFDDSQPDILEEIALAVQQGTDRRRIHLILENDHNCVRYLERTRAGRPRYFTAQWNDDIHHAAHTLLTGENDGYYADYSDAPIHHLGRALAEGFAYQGEISRYRNNTPRGEPSGHLPPTAFVSFLQNHDQIGNRALGERLLSLCAPEDLLLAAVLLLLAPSPPLIFMGEEFGAASPFYFFCDFGPELAASVTRGRREEFARFPQFRSAATRERIPDPNSEETVQASKLLWPLPTDGEKAEHLHHYREILAVRRREIIPGLQGIKGGRAGWRVFTAHSLHAWWTLGDGSLLRVFFNLGDGQVPTGGLMRGRSFYRWPPDREEMWNDSTLPAKSIGWFRDRQEAMNG